MRPSTLARTLAIVSLLAVVGAACDQPKGTGTPPPPGATQAAGTTRPGATVEPGQTGTVSAPTATALDQITAALEDGSLDFETALTYRLYAAAGDDRLPAAFAGAANDDPGASTAALAAFDQLAPETQAQLLPFLVRPTDPASWYAAGPGGVAFASVRVAAATCNNGWIQQPTSAPAKVMIWGQCGGGQADSAVQAQVDAAKANMEALWGPMTNLMGPPIGDSNAGNTGTAISPEGGDGLIDIYLVNRAVTQHGRNISSGAGAMTYGAAPHGGPAQARTASGYIVVNALRYTGNTFKSTLAHEFFHVLEQAHNDQGILYAPKGTTGRWVDPWFVEASAVWAEHEFVPEAQDTQVYPRFTRDFLLTTKGLSDLSADNEYASYMWPLFLEQEIGPWAIRDAWRAIEGKDGFQETQQAIDSVLSFSDRFHDFAVRAFNTDLEPGNPIDPLFQALDPKFPTDTPSGRRATYNVPVASDAGLQSFTISIPSLGSRYWDLVPDANAKEITLDFLTLLPMDAVDVDVLLLQNGQWTRKRVNVEEEDQAFCNVTKAIVVISNHAQDPDTDLVGSWTVGARSQACEVGSYSVTLAGVGVGAGTYTGTGNVYCTATTVGGRIYWSAIAIFPSAGLTGVSQFNMEQNPSGFDSVQAQAGGADGIWAARSDILGQTAHVAGSGAPGTNAHVTGEGTFTDTAGATYTIHIAADCSDTTY